MPPAIHATQASFGETLKYLGKKKTFWLIALGAAIKAFIGYGHARSARPGAVINEAEAELLLQYDLMPIVALLNERVRLPLNQHQFDALASFIFSIGLERFQGSDVQAKLDANAPSEAAVALFASLDQPDET